MEFQKNDIIKFLNISLQTTPGEGCGPQANEVNKLPKSFDGLTVDASVGIGRATSIPWVTFTGYGQKTKNGIYPALLYYHERNILIVAFGVSASNKPEQSWDIDGLKTLDEFFIERKIKQTHIEKKYNSSFIHSCFPVPTIGGKVDESKFNVDAVFKSLKEVCVLYKKQFEDKDTTKGMVGETEQKPFNIETVIEKIKKTGLLYEDNLIKRYVYSLMTKPFVILSGLAGSGKTQLALAFARVMCENIDQQMCVVPVGADWTNREPLLGYPNALDAEKYVRPESGVLDLLIEANKEENQNKPFFLILDEMNLSYVERYFADFLSAMESHQAIKLWKKDSACKDDTPESILLPQNLFIIGTINVDETTYMFSPKVLDRANVIEFTVSEDEMSKFLEASPDVDIKLCEGLAADMAADFVNIASTKKEMSSEANDVLNEFFKNLKKANAEFGYRTATEIGRFISLALESMSEDEAVDAALVQKLLPKLHGSRKKIVSVTKELWKLCGCEDLDTLENPDPTIAKYKLTADKVLRMYNSALENGFTSFAEA